MARISQLEPKSNPSPSAYGIINEDGITYKTLISNFPPPMLDVSGASGTSGNDANNGESGTTGTDGLGGESASGAVSGDDGSSGISENGGDSGLSGIDAIEPIIISEPFSEYLVFDQNKYYDEYTQTSTLNFNKISGDTIMCVIQSTINVDSRYSIYFDNGFTQYRNDLSSGDGLYEFWFVQTPLNILYSVIKIGEYTPEPDIIPYSANIIARYSPYNLELDPVSGRITKITNIYNTGTTLTSITNTKRPIFDGDINRIIFNSTGVTENLNGTSTVEFTPNNTWYGVFLLQASCQRIGSTDKGTDILSKLGTRILKLFNAADIHYLNGTLLSLPANDDILNKLGGVHIFGINQTDSGTELYIDGVLVGSNSTVSTSGLSLSNIYSIYNSTTAQITNIEYLYDSLFYDKSMDSTERAAINDFLVLKHPNYNPANGGVLSNYMTTDVVSGSTLHSGSTISVSFTYTATIPGSQPIQIVTIIKQGGGTLKSLIYSTYLGLVSYTGTTYDCSAVITLPGGMTATTNYFTSSYIIDQNGLATNNQDYTAIKFAYS